MVNIGYRAARMQGHFFRSLYNAALPSIVNLQIPQTRKVEMAVYSFSCERDLPEQVASIRSFIRYVGIPDRFTVISDGSYSSTSRQLLHQISPCVNVVDQESMMKKGLPQSVHAYANYHPLGKKLAVLMSIPIDQVTIYADSDILFFPAAEELVSLAQSGERRPRYLPDCTMALDERVLHKPSEKSNPVNSGFMLLQKPLDWEISLNRLRLLGEPPNYFTEQSLVHLTMHYNQGLPLPNHQFVVSLEDEFIYPDMHASKGIYIRHYVNPVRHKFWLKVKV